MLVTGQVFAEGLAAGKAKAEAACQVCHGMDGQATEPMVPHVSGQQKEYLIAALKAYRSGKRQHEQMSIVVKTLTDEDINNVSEWYSNIKVSIERPE